MDLTPLTLTERRLLERTVRQARALLVRKHAGEESRPGESSPGGAAQVDYQHWQRWLLARMTAASIDRDARKSPRTAWQPTDDYAGGSSPSGTPRALPKTARRELTTLLEELPDRVLRGSDALGWAYQFWQAPTRQSIHDGNLAVGACELPPSTQLFSEPYMVRFLLHNTLGAWWVARHGHSSMPLALTHLRLDPRSRPLAGGFEGWPERAAELSLVDPCCGAGHFLIEALQILVHFRRAEEGLTPAEAAAAVLRDNLHGLELDPNCADVARLGLDMAARQLAGPGTIAGSLPQARVAQAGRPPEWSLEEGLIHDGGDAETRARITHLHGLLQQAPLAGSLLQPGAHREAKAGISAEDIEALGRALTGGTIPASLQAAAMLARRYTLVATNVPFLGHSSMDPQLRSWCAEHFPRSRSDLATVFLERCAGLDAPGGTLAAVLPSTWLSYTRYFEALRRKMLTTRRWDMVALLGKRAFAALDGELVQVCLHISSDQPPDAHTRVPLLDVRDATRGTDKATRLHEVDAQHVPQLAQRDNPGSALVVPEAERDTEGPLLSDFVDCYEGLSRGDTERFSRRFWELPSLDSPAWRRLVESPEESGPATGRSSVFRWDGGRGPLVAHPSARIQGQPAWQRQGVVVSRTHCKATLSRGEAFAQNCVCLVPRDPADLPAVWAFCNSPEYRRAVSSLNQKLIKPSGVMDKVVFDRPRWQRRAPDAAALAARPVCHDPRQADFNGASEDMRHPLHVAVARLLGYRWPGQRDDGLEALADTEGLVALPAIGDRPAGHARLESVLAKVFGPGWDAETRARLLQEVGCAGWSLQRWLANRFFAQHCKLFARRPFVWHIWDGQPDGFAALLHYHRLDRGLLEQLTHGLLEEWIAEQRDHAGRTDDEAAHRLQAARRLQQQLELLLRGEAPQDIFVRWKPLHAQPLGWAPDLDDGVRVNIRPLLRVDDVAARGAGILRVAPGIDWKRDRGSDPRESPWYDLGPSHGARPGDRVNDHHLRLAEKWRARRPSSGAATDTSPPGGEQDSPAHL